MRDYNKFCEDVEHFGSALEERTKIIRGRLDNLKISYTDITKEITAKTHALTILLMTQRGFKFENKWCLKNTNDTLEVRDGIIYMRRYNARKFNRLDTLYTYAPIRRFLPDLFHIALDRLIDNHYKIGESAKFQKTFPLKEMEVSYPDWASFKLTKEKIPSISIIMDFNQEYKLYTNSLQGERKMFNYKMLLDDNLYTLLLSLLDMMKEEQIKMTRRIEKLRQESMEILDGKWKEIIMEYKLMGRH